MTLLLFKYILPGLLGYTLFVGIAARFNPINKPADLAERPSWMLGIWTGLSVSLVLGIGLHMAYDMPLEAAKSLAMPAASSLAALLGMGFMAYLTYNRHIGMLLDHEEIESESEEITWASKVQQLDPLLGRKRSKTSSTPSHMQPEQQDKASFSTGAVIEFTDHQLKRLEGSSTQELDITLEPAKNEDLEATIRQLRKDLVSAKHEVRSHVAARANALSTANKSIAFARQSIELRAQLENELANARETLAVRQSTIVRLIQRLETEQRLSDKELAVLKGYSNREDDSLTQTPLRYGTTN
ncbi:MAG: hypothetical protein AB8B84_06740 [Granulosicoccus sp.]